MYSHPRPGAGLPVKYRKHKEQEELATTTTTLQGNISEEILSEYVGETLPVLIEKPSDEWPGLYVGRTWFQAPEVDGVTYVSAPPETELTPGTIVDVEIEKADTYDLSGLV